MRKLCILEFTEGLGSGTLFQTIQKREEVTMPIQRWIPRWGIHPWQPSSEVENLEQHYWSNYDHPYWPMAWRRVPTEEMGWLPAIEMYEKENLYVVRAELPGMIAEDIANALIVAS